MGDSCSVCHQLDGHKMSCPVAKGRLTLPVTLEVAGINAQRPKLAMLQEERVTVATAAMYAAALSRGAELAGLAALGFGELVAAEVERAGMQAYGDWMERTEVRRGD